MSARKSFTDLYINRPIVALVVSMVIVIIGLQSYFTLNVRQYPKNENAVITITTAYVGADAKLVRGFITTPIERAIAAADGIDYIESNSVLGLSTIRARLKLNYDGKTALAEISTKVDQVRGDLPPESEVPVLTIETADAKIAASYLSFRSDILEANEVTDYLTRVVQPRLSAVVGVQRADILGAQNYAMRIWLKPDKLASLNISPAQVNQAIAAEYQGGTRQGGADQVQLLERDRTTLELLAVAANHLADDIGTDILNTAQVDFFHPAKIATWNIENGRDAQFGKQPR